MHIIKHITFYYNFNLDNTYTCTLKHIMQDTFSPFELLQQEEFCQRGIVPFVFIYNNATSHKNGVAAEWHSTVVDPLCTHVSYRDPLVSGRDVSVHRTDGFAISCHPTNCVERPST